MSMKESVRELVAPAIKDLGVEVYDVKYEKVGNDYFLRIIIDSDEKEIDLDLCVQATEIINPILDEADLIDHEYYLEVTTRGVERELETPEEIESAVGKFVAITTYEKVEGEKEFIGYLNNYDEEKYTISIEGTLVEIPAKLVSKIRLSVEF